MIFMNVMKTNKEVYNEKSTTIGNTYIHILSSDKHLLMLQDSKEIVQQAKNTWRFCDRPPKIFLLKPNKNEIWRWSAYRLVLAKEGLPTESTQLNG